MDFRCSCPHCGIYSISDELSQTTLLRELDPQLRLRLRHVVRLASDERKAFGELLDVSSYRQIIDRVALPDPVEQADMLIDAVARRGAWGEGTRTEPVQSWNARIALLRDEQLFELGHALRDLVVFQVPSGNDITFKLTLPGWQRARQIRQTKGPGSQAFVAMWFHPAMKSCFINALEPALKAVGHRAYRVDFKEHNNKIDDEIVGEIRRSRLVIVETTGARNSVYFEAGFAAGLGIPVIWCCHATWNGAVVEAPQHDQQDRPSAKIETWVKLLPFDIRQQNFVLWDSEADLHEKLVKRVRALGLDLEPIQAQ